MALHLSQPFFDFSLQPISAGSYPFLPFSPTQVAFIISFISKVQLYFFQIALLLLAKIIVTYCKRHPVAVQATGAMENFSPCCGCCAVVPVLLLGETTEA